MISALQADKIIEKNVPRFLPVIRPLKKAYGAILHEDIFADRDLPPFHKSLMDGIAINSLSYKDGNRSFLIQGIQAAGEEQSNLKSKFNCFEIMTGAVVPQGCNCVIPVEYIRIKNGKATIHSKIKIFPLMNIILRGSDYKRGRKLLSKGCILNSPQIAVIASVGKAKIKVGHKPKIAIISTGDELIDIDQPIKPFQVRLSNSYALQSAFEQSNLFQSAIFHIRDDKSQLLNKIGQILKEFDVLVLSGGVSMGKFDYVPEVLKKLKVKVLFHKVQQKPGKPFWFGKSPKGQPVFALPGNPVSTLVCADRYVLPQLKKALGLKDNRVEHVQLLSKFIPTTNLTYFLPVQVLCDRQTKLTANFVSISNSGDFVSLANADGFVELPAGQKYFDRGYQARLFRF